MGKRKIATSSPKNDGTIITSLKKKNPLAVTDEQQLGCVRNLYSS